MTDILQLSGTDLFYSIVSGMKELGHKIDHINTINVFPVADGDTGTNMFATIQGAILASSPNAKISDTAESLARGSVMSSRGNSGTILAQIFSTLSRSWNKKSTVDADEFVSGWLNVSTEIQTCLEKPAAGTIIDVIKEWTQQLKNAVPHEKSITRLLSNSYSALKQSVYNTRNNMELLEKAGVNDAGAEGLMIFISGWIKYLENPENIDTNYEITTNEEFIPHADSSMEDIRFRYCTEGVISLHGEDSGSLETIIRKYGDSFARAKAAGYFRFHIHTNDPEELFAELFKVGKIMNPKAEDMKLQTSAHLHKGKKTAIVVDSSCDIPPALCEKYGIFVVPINMLFDGSQFLDKVTMNTDRFYRLLEDAIEYPTTSQPAVSSFENLYRFLLSHFTEIVSVHISSALSGTFNSALQASRKVNEKRIKIVDSKNLSASFGLLVLDMVRNRKDDWSSAQISEYLESRTEKANILVSVKTMKYMVKSGRVSPLKGIIGKILNLKPIIGLDGKGKSALFGKAFSRSASLEKVIAKITSLNQEKRLNSYCVGHAHDENLAKALAERLEKETGRKPEFTMDIAPVIGLHAGRGAVCVAYTEL